MTFCFLNPDKNLGLLDRVRCLCFKETLWGLVRGYCRNQVESGHMMTSHRIYDLSLSSIYEFNIAHHCKDVSLLAHVVCIDTSVNKGLQYFSAVGVKLLFASVKDYHVWRIILTRQNSLWFGESLRWISTNKPYTCRPRHMNKTNKLQHPNSYQTFN